MARSSRRPSSMRYTASALAGAFCLAALVYLSINVARDLRLLNSASSDNVQWTLSQSEVEFLEFQIHLAALPGDGGDELRALRREYDIFYSRITTLEQSSIYSELRAEPEFSRNLRIVKTFLDRTVPLIDAPDAELAASVPELQARAEEVRPNVRALANSGLNYFAVDSDRRRDNVAVTLTQLAVGVTVLVLALLAFAAYLNFLNRQNVRRRREVLESARRMNVVTSTALDGVIVIDKAGTVLDFNAAATQIFGYSAEEALGANLGALIVPEEYRAAHDAGMQRMRDGGEQRVVGKGRVKLAARRKSGEVFPVEFAIQSAETDDGTIFISFLRDISHRVQAEQELVETRDRALAGEKAKTDFLATMSHEIRTPLNGLLGNLELMQDTRLSARQARYVKNMDTSGKLLMSHISDVLDITKYDAGKLQLRPVAMNLSTLLQDIVDNQSGAALAQDTTLEWGWSGPQLDWIRADRDRLQHVLMNIIGNAVKFTRGGRVTVEAEQLGGANNPEVQITVSDTGIGMEAGLQAHIFDDFMTGDSSYDREVGGTGLGLGIAQRFVKALGGSIEVESEAGVGSSFMVRLPVEPIAAPGPEVAARKPRSKAMASKVLLVEDNEINRVVAREMLEAAGHTVTLAHNGREAVEKAGTAPFDLILMDISMPVMDGREATRAIRAGHGPCARVPIIALTANAVAEEQEAFLSDGMDDIVTKPLSRAALDRVLADHSGADRPERAAENPAVAVSYLDELRDTLGVEAMGGLLDRFGSEVDAHLAFLETSADDDLADTAARTHKIAGSAATLGAVALRAALVGIEDAAKAGDTKGMCKGIDALPEVWAQTRAALVAERRKAPRP
ncbi:PAS domain-containing hybrid sensor histidine kinase/response regulator [Oceanicola sp. 502str15]|uniref:PAS domain-containing hybrid sensor histidine kinase/response regulator n=1 Tax=Oceanicola sp. 502str15 TaxID=2696061 RepID=UPI00209593C9|nr:PAS domain-containing hybrid sensor histidine kinase/response regulator [Oceanicola sp. 502str15]MCO6383010.1 PAS domain S-box protein [Oceanicola sp. 502str15]